MGDDRRVERARGDLNALRGRSGVLLKVTALSTNFYTSRAVVRAVRGVSFEVESGETVALIGESGSGKSVAALSIMRLLPRTARIIDGVVMFGGLSVLQCEDKQMRDLRGREISMVFQDPTISFDPVYTVGYQLGEIMRRHLKLDNSQILSKSISLLESMNIADPARRLQSYPHELSGGMLQRIMVALAISCGPRLLIADEPTTNLDATLQAQVLDLLATAVRKERIALLLITHNLGVVARYADKVNIMYLGRIVESAAVDALYAHPLHPYTGGLLASVPRLDVPLSGSRSRLRGSPPTASEETVGCAFAARCGFSRPTCWDERPPLVDVSNSHYVACHNY